MTNKLPPRRTACDRCRSHKLRCRRDGSENHNDKCQRCLRAGLDCTTSATARIGRPVNGFRRPHEHVSIQGQEEEPTRSNMPTPISIVTDGQLNSSSDTVTREVYQQAIRTWSTPTSNSCSDISNVVQGTALDHQESQVQNKDSFDVLDPSKLQSLPPPLDLREACVRKLAGLHSSLVLDLNIVRGCQTADKCLSIIRMPEFSQSYNFCIGRMLSSSASFVEILGYFVPSLKSNTERILLHCDVPTLHTIFTCYVYLIRIHRTIFTCIYKSILHPPDPPAKLPPLFPGLQLGGYSLEPHFDLQVKILIQVCQDMLEKIDTAMGLRSSDGEEENNGLLSQSGTSSELLQSMLENELMEEQSEGIMAGDHKNLTEIFDCLKAVESMSVV